MIINYRRSADYCNDLECRLHKKISETWMDLDETWQVGLRPEKTKPCTFPAKSRYGFRESVKKWVAEALFFFCHVNHALLLPLSLDRFPPNLSRWWLATHGFIFQRVSRKTLFFGYPICDQPAGHRKRSAMPTLFPSPVDIPQMCLSWVTFAEGCTVFQLSTSESDPLPHYQQWAYLDGDTVAPPGKRRGTTQ